MSVRSSWTSGSVLVTGAASGLGSATARRLHRDGVPLVLGDVQRESVESLASELGASALAVSMDVTRPEDVEAAISSAQEMAPLRSVVHCAGVLAAARLVSRRGIHDLDLFRRTIEVNLTGSFNVLRLASAAMQQNEMGPGEERGVVVLTASVAALEGQIGQIAYAASKGGVASMVLPAARELGKWGIRVVGVAPGAFSTPMLAGAPDPVMESIMSQTVFPKRLGDPDEFAEICRHILDNQMLNGNVIRLDGAMRMPP